MIRLHSITHQGHTPQLLRNRPEVCRSQQSPETLAVFLAGHHGQRQTQCLMPGLFLPQGFWFLRTMACFSLPIPVLPLGPGCVCALISLSQRAGTLYLGGEQEIPRLRASEFGILNPFSLALRSNSWKWTPKVYRGRAQTT